MVEWWKNVVNLKLGRTQRTKSRAAAQLPENVIRNGILVYNVDIERHYIVYTSIIIFNRIKIYDARYAAE